MLRVQRLDQINALKPANLFDSKSLTLKFRSEQIGRFKTAIRPEQRMGEPLLTVADVTANGNFTEPGWRTVAGVPEQNTNGDSPA